MKLELSCFSLTKVLVIIGLAFGLSSCIEQPNSFSKLPPGEWRGILKLTDPDLVMADPIGEQDMKVKDFFELPFNMKVEYEGDDMNVYLLNGAEAIKIESVHYGRDPSTAKDTIQLGFDAFDTSMDGFFEDNFIEGYWTVNYKENYKIPFLAIYGQNHRFINKPYTETADFSGQWKVIFEYDNENAYPAIGEFHQIDNELTGTFLTETGDYRYLAGNAYNDKMRLSVFDGSHAFLFEGSLQKDTIYGEFRSGKHYKSKWKAYKTADYNLTDPYAMTQSVEVEQVDFSFPDENNTLVNLNDEQYKDKIKLVNIMGTWCPNCKDEIHFLKEVDKEIKEELAIFTIAFERYRDAEKSQAVIKKYKEKLGFHWPILLGGYANKKETGETFPFLDKIYSYPTLLILDKDNKIRYIHTGFNGPATSKYANFKKDFNSKLSAIISES